MREMKDSGNNFVGAIPVNWRMIPLKNVVLFNCDTLSEQISPDYEFDYIDIGAVRNGVGIEEFQKMTFRNAPSRARRKVMAGDVVVSTVRTYLKAIAQIPEHEKDIVVSTGFLVLRASQQIEKKYLRYCVEVDSFVSEIEAKSVGISYPAINATEAVATKVVIPPIEEQHKIADYLDEKCGKIDAVIEKQQAIIEKLKEYKLSLITEAVTKGLDPDVPMKESGIEWIGAIPEDWRVGKLKYMGRFVNGYAFASNTFVSNGIRVLKIANVQPMRISWLEESYVSELEYDRLPMYRVEKGDLVFALTRPIINDGIKVAVFEDDDKVLLNQRNAMFKGMRGILPRWLYYVMQNKMYIQEFVLNIDGTGQQPNISTHEIAGIAMPIPPMEVQELIIERLNTKTDKINNIIADKVLLIDKMKEYKKSLIYEVVTGKKEV